MIQEQKFGFIGKADIMVIAVLHLVEKGTVPFFRQLVTKTKFMMIFIPLKRYSSF